MFVDQAKDQVETAARTYKITESKLKSLRLAVRKKLLSQIFLISVTLALWTVDCSDNYLRHFCCLRPQRNSDFLCFCPVYKFIYLLTYLLTYCFRVDE